MTDGSPVVPTGGFRVSQGQGMDSQRFLRPHPKEREGKDSLPDSVFVFRAPDDSQAVGSRKATHKLIQLRLVEAPSFFCPGEHDLR